jgi:hypothetical protein
VLAADALGLERPRHQPTFRAFHQLARFEIWAVVVERDADGRERGHEPQQVERVRVGIGAPAPMRCPLRVCCSAIARGIHLGAQDAELVAFSHNQFTASAVG